MSLLDGLTTRRLEIDMFRLSGPRLQKRGQPAIGVETGEEWFDQGGVFGRMGRTEQFGLFIRRMYWY